MKNRQYYQIISSWVFSVFCFLCSSAQVSIFRWFPNTLYCFVQNAPSAPSCCPSKFRSSLIIKLIYYSPMHLFSLNRPFGKSKSQLWRPNGLGFDCFSVIRQSEWSSEWSCSTHFLRALASELKPVGSKGENLGINCLFILAVSI